MLISDNSQMLLYRRQLLLSKQSLHPLQYAVLVGIVRVIFRGNLEHGGEGCRVALDAVSYPFSNVLVYEQDCNVLAFGGEAVESSLDGAVFGFGVDDEEVLLRIWGLRDNVIFHGSIQRPSIPRRHWR